MADRIVRVKLSAQVQEYIAGMEQAAQKTRETSSEAQQLTQRRADFQALGTALVTFGGVVTAIGVAAAKTGIEYNTMQQTTRAALTTLLGSATAANAQMDKLDEFARTSPFAKTTFITAQQQMLAFGIETRKVIPYLDAVQDAVAAAGGSNADIEAIVATMSKIQSSSKITAQDLIEFGNRGVNAAELIGSQMGKTGAQIRADITAGSLGATEALDALAAGMSSRFGGAAENVKETFAGAMDRVKAAWRDFSAELARPLVDPEGGGGLVDLLNWTADAMRNFEKLPEPVKATVTALTGLVGVGSLVTGAAILAIPKWVEKWVEFRGALDALQITGGSVRDRLGGIVRFLGGPWGIAMAAATISVIAFNNAMNESKASARDFEIGIKQGSNALDVMRETAAKNEQGLVTAFVNVGQHIEELPALLNKAETSGRGFFSSLSFNEQAALDNLSALGDELARLAATDLDSAQAEFVAFADAAGLTRREAGLALDEMPEFKKALLDAADAAGAATDDASLLAYALGGELSPAADDAAGSADDSAKSLEEFQGVANDTSDAVSALADEIFNLIDALMESNNVAQTAEGANARYQQTLADVAEYVANAQAGVEGYSASLDENTVEGSKNREMLAGMAADSQAAAAAIYEQELKTLGAEQATANYRDRLEQGRAALYNVLLELTGNAEAAQVLTDKLYAMPSQKDIDVLLDTATATAKLNEWLVPRTMTIYADLARRGDWSTPLKVPGSANGNLFQFANGGGLETGIYSGGMPLTRFAEPETRWEAFISGKPGQEDRNRQIWVEAGRRLGVGPAGESGTTAVSLAGARFTFEVEGRPFTGVIREQIAEASSVAGSRVSRGTDRRF